MILSIKSVGILLVFKESIGDSNLVPYMLDVLLALDA